MSLVPEGGTADVPGAHAPPIGDHRLLGDGHTTALVRPDAEIDWWCAPLPHSDPLLWSLLDRAGGSARFVGPVDVLPALTEADGPVAGPSLRTILGGEGRIVVHDALLPATRGGSALVRTVHAADRATALQHLLRLGGFGGSAPAPTPEGLRVDGHCWRLHTIGAVTTDGAVDLVTDLVLDPADQPVVLVVTADPSFDVRLDNLLDRVRRLAGGDLEGVATEPSGPVVTGPRRRLADSLDVLRAGTWSPSGAPLAAPTTSLPEVPGADRQWDYRYTWLRDGSLGAAVSAVVGAHDVADGYLRFLEELGPERMLRAPMWCVDATPVPAEVEVPGVEGWAGSRPVRVGNGARSQLQYDALGFVVEAIGIVARHDGELPPRRWDLVAAIADRLSGGPPPPSAGIWELRDRRPLVAADIGIWMALDHATRLADRHRGGAPTAWNAAQLAAQRRVRAAVTADGLLPQSYDDGTGTTPVPDASSLLAVICRLLEPGDPAADRLIDRCVEELGTGPHLHRYPPGEDDGFHGIEATFVPASFWVVTALATVGRHDEAEARFEQLDAELPRLLAEQWDPVARRSLGNVPLAWSHIEAVRALYALDDSIAV